MAGIPGLENLAGGVSGTVNTASLVAKYIFWGVLVGGLLWYVYYIGSFNVKVLINQRNTSRGLLGRWDKGKFKKNKDNPNIMMFCMLKDKRWNIPLDRSYITYEQRAWGRIGMLVQFIEDEQGRIQPVKPVSTDATVQWTGWDNNSQEFMLRNLKEVYERFKKGDFWDKYGNLIQIGAYLLLFVMVLVLFRELRGVTEGLSNVAASLDGIAKNMGAGAQIIQQG